jgi:hypothetical protein
VRAALEPIGPNFAQLMRDLDFCPPECFHYGGVNYPLHHAETPFLQVGAQRSGKSAHAKLLALTALQSIKHGLTESAFWFDFKGEYLAWLRLVLPGSSIKYIEPFDLENGVAWDVAAEITSIAEAEAMGRLLAPTNPEGREPFFDDSAGNAIAGIVVSLYVTRGHDWILSDLTKILSGGPNAIRYALARVPELNRGRIEFYFNNAQKMNRDVLGTLGNRTSDLAAAALQWEKASERVTLVGWKTGKFALLLGYSHNYPEATKAISRALLSKMSRLILAEPDWYFPRSWVFLDELPFFGRLDSLPGLLSLGPAKGLAASVSFQDVGLMRHVYGPDLMQAINGLTPQKLFCRLSDVDTAEWASRHFGEVERTRLTRSISHANGEHPSTTFSLGEHYDRTRAVRPEDFLTIRPLSPPVVNELVSYVVSPVLGNYAHALHIDTIRRLLPRGSQASTPRSLQLLPEPPRPSLPTHDDDDSALPYL